MNLAYLLTCVIVGASIGWFIEPVILRIDVALIASGATYLWYLYKRG